MPLLGATLRPARAAPGIRPSHGAMIRHAPSRAARVCDAARRRMAPRDEAGPGPCHGRRSVWGHPWEGGLLMVRYESVIESIGGTPLVRVHRLAAGLLPRVYVKLEHQNPGGSVKDRAALSMIRAAERDGSLRPGGTVVEVTSGNTGVGLALVAAHLGYRTVVFTPSQIAVEKIRLLRAYGAEVRVVDAFVPRGHP